MITTAFLIVFITSSIGAIYTFKNLKKKRKTRSSRIR